MRNIEYCRGLEKIADKVEKEVEISEEEQKIVVLNIVDKHKWLRYSDSCLDILKYASNKPKDSLEFMKPDELDWKEIIRLMAFESLKKDLLDKLNE